ncbi:hypothetical protein ACGFZH_28060 [Streptomyces zaomyceticus]|uniref:hypothetical protein n=1 Tax=Streptomyces zaomyceticus TaxID=68286 RepID=UPI0037150780
MNAKRVAAAEGVILAAMKNRVTAAGIAVALESACLLQSPESAAELVRRRIEGLALRTERAPMDGPRQVPFELGVSLLPAVQWLVARDSDWSVQVSRLTARVDEVERAYTFDTAALKKHVAELEAERHSTNEALDDAVKALRVQRDRIAELEAERATAIADRDAQIVAWLGKKAREYGESNREARAKAEAVWRMADKLSRGAVRPALPLQTTTATAGSAL